MTKAMEQVFEIRSNGSVLAQFSSQNKAVREMRRLRKEGKDVRVYSKWVEKGPVTPKLKPFAKKSPPRIKKKESPHRRTKGVGVVGKVRPYTPINQYLSKKGMRPIDRDITFQELYTGIIVDLRTMEEVLGECKGRKAEIIRGLVEAMDHPSITVRYVESILAETDKRRKSMKNEPSERWIDSMGWPVQREAAEEFARYWGSITEPFFLAAYRNGVPCDPDVRDSDLSVQPTDTGLALCYREVEDRKVYIVLKSIDWVQIGNGHLEVFGRLRDGSNGRRSFPIAEEQRMPVSKNSGIKEGWYLIDSSYLTYLQPRPRSRKDDFEVDFDYCIDFLTVYPGFGQYQCRDGTFAIRNDMSLNDFFSMFYKAKRVEYVPIDDPGALRDAFKRSDLDYIGLMESRYPKLRLRTRRSDVRKEEGGMPLVLRVRFEVRFQGNIPVR